MVWEVEGKEESNEREIAREERRRVGTEGLSLRGGLRSIHEGKEQEI